MTTATMTDLELHTKNNEIVAEMKELAIKFADKTANGLDVEAAVWAIQSFEVCRVEMASRGVTISARKPTQYTAQHKSYGMLPGEHLVDTLSRVIKTY